MYVVNVQYQAKKICETSYKDDAPLKASQSVHAFQRRPHADYLINAIDLSCEDLIFL